MLSRLDASAGFCLLVATFAASPMSATDCNDNGVDDNGEIGTGSAEDCNRNGLPDECERSDALIHRDRYDGVPADHDVPRSGRGAAVLDLTGDGLPDVLTSGSDAAVVLFENAGSGTLHAPRDLSELVVRYPAVADVDLDGTDDLVFATDDGIRVAFDNDVASLSGAPQIEVEVRALTIGDMNGDALPDVLAVSTDDDDTVRVFLNTGERAFAEGQDPAQR